MGNESMPHIAGDLTEPVSSLVEDAGAPTKTSDEGSYSTGISVLDRQLNGGLPAGGLIVIEAPAESSGEELLHSIARVDDYSTLYVSMSRPASMIKDDLTRVGESYNASPVFMSDGVESETGWLYDIPAYMKQWVQCSIIIDTYTEYALRCADETHSLAVLTEAVRDAGGLVVLLVHNGATPREARIARQAKHMADVVFDYQQADSEDGSDRLVIPKYRQRQEAGLELPAVIDLNVTDSLTVNDTRAFS